MEIFKKTPEEEIEKIENEIKQIEAEKAPLEREQAVLGTKARIEGIQSEKEKLQTERGKLYVQTNQLKEKIEELKEKVAEPKKTILVKNNRHDIIIKVNGTRLKIPENLELTIPFSCGHELKIQVDEIFRYQTSIRTNQQLLSFWERTITFHESHAKIFVCEQCQRERKAYVEKHHAIPSKRSGTARISVEVI
jgi:ATP-dependent Clp protease ATP-binding subunit ClpA